MTRPIRISGEAAAEMVGASRWYESHREGLGAEFIDAVDHAVDRIAETPQMGSSVPSVVDAAIRRRAVRRFPYHVVYLEIADRIQILAVAHDRRRPAYWLDRLPA